MTHAFSPSPGVASLSRKEKLRWFLREWLLRFSGCPAVLNQTCCLSFLSAWMEVAAPHWSRLGVPGMSEKSGVESGEGGLASARAVCDVVRNSQGVSVHKWAEYFPVVEAPTDSPLIGDVAWLELSRGENSPWLGVCGIFGGWIEPAEEFWWTISSPADCSPHPVATARLAQRPYIFRPSETKDAIVSAMGRVPLHRDGGGGVMSDDVQMVFDSEQVTCWRSSLPG